MTETDAPVQRSRMLVYESSGLSFRKFTVEIDLTLRRLRLFRQWFGRWTKTLVDCSLDDCVAVGTVEYNPEGHLSYGTYFKLKSGYWNAIPSDGNSFEETVSIVKQVSAATNIPRLDIKYS